MAERLTTLTIKIMRILKAANGINTRNTGLGRVMHSTADELRSLGHEVDLLFSEDVVRTRLLSLDRFGFPFALAKAIRKRIRSSGNYDVVEIHEPSAAWYCYARRFDRSLPPCVIMSHGLEENYWRHRLELDRIFHQKTSLKSRVSMPLTLLPQVRYGLRHSQQVMCLNSLDQAFLRDRLSLPVERISRIQNGVDPHFFGKREYSCAVPRLLFVGGWLDNKGRRVIPEVFQRLHAEFPETKISLLGTGCPIETVLSDFVPAVREHVTVEPRVNDVRLRTAYAEHEILLLPSFFEAWGLVLLEAAAMEMAIVTSPAGGPSDLFTEGEEALFAPAISSEQITEATRRLIQDPALRRCLGMNAQRRARQFTWRAAAQSHLNAYERALEA